MNTRDAYKIRANKTSGNRPAANRSGANRRQSSAPVNMAMSCNATGNTNHSSSDLSVNNTGFAKPSGSNHHVLTDGYTNARLAHCEDSVKGRFDVIEETLRKISNLHYGEGFIEQAQNIALKELGYRFDEVHSELDALLRYKGPKDNLKLFNYRFNRFGDMRMSKPCCKCLPWCLALFDKIWYSTDEGMEML